MRKLRYGEIEKKTEQNKENQLEKNKNKLKLAPQLYSSAKNTVRVLVIEPPITFSLSYCALSYYASSFLYFYVVTKRLHIMTRILSMVKLITISKTVKDMDCQLWSYDSNKKITFFDNICSLQILF